MRFVRKDDGHHVVEELTMQLSRSWGKTLFAEKGRAVAQPAAALLYWEMGKGPF